jgi:hypothetical protein
MSGETKQRIGDLEAEIVRLRTAQPTLRDQFAMAALTGLVGNFTTVTEAVTVAFYVADKMMEVRDEKTN